MTGAGAEAVAVLVLVASLVFAVLRPRGLTEAVVAVPAAAVVVATGIVPLDAAGDAWEARTTAPTAPSGVALGMPALGVPGPLPDAPACR